MNIAVCDDEQAVIATIKQIFDGYLAEHPLISAEISYFTSSVRLEKEINNGAVFDAYFLDVILDGKNGIRIASLIRSTNSEAPIVFLTSSKDYAFAAFGVRACNYLLKPVSSEQLISEFERILAASQPKAVQKTLFSVPSLRSSVDIVIQDIVYIKTTAHIFYFYMANGQRVESSTMRIGIDEFLEPIIKTGCFLQVRRGTIINLNYVRMVSNDEFVMTNGIKIKPSKSNFVELRKKYFGFLANSKGE